MKHTFSVIICTFNRCDDLQNTLESLKNQSCDWSAVKEIIVVDNNSTDRTPEIIASYLNAFQTMATHLTETRRGKSHALNLAIQTSRSDVLVFTDDDVILDGGWLHEMMMFFENHDVDIVGGKVDPIYPPKTPGWIKNNRFELRGPIGTFDLGPEVLDYRSGKVTDFPGANVAFKKKVYEDVGLYSSELGPGLGTLFEDIDMFRRAVRAGKNIFYNPRALVRHKSHPSRLNIKYLATWSFRLGKSIVIMEPFRHKEKSPLIFGVPRWMYRAIATAVAKLPLSIGKQKALIQSWIHLYYNLGMAAGYARYHQANRKERAWA